MPTRLDQARARSSDYSRPGVPLRHRHRRAVLRAARHCGQLPDEAGERHRVIVELGVHGPGRQHYAACAGAGCQPVAPDGRSPDPQARMPAGLATGTPFPAIRALTVALAILQLRASRRCRFALRRAPPGVGLAATKVSGVAPTTGHATRRRADATPGPCAVVFSAMAPKRMNRDEFFAQLSRLDDHQIKKALWNLYWRGSAQLRERIEGEFDPAAQAEKTRAAAQPPDPESVLWDVREFVELARAGAYMYGDRRVSPKERSRWRSTFKRLATDALSALRARDAGPAREAVALIIDLACETRGTDYFHSDDPMEAARFVVSDAVEILWKTVRDIQGFGSFAELAAVQLPRWESRYGWTRSACGQLSLKETSLASLLAEMLYAPDMWAMFADRYLDALDRIARSGAAGRSSRRAHGYDSEGFARRERTGHLAEWHGLLLDRLAGAEGEDRLDRLVQHPALSGPDLTFLRARLALHRDDLDLARKLVQECLQDLPGHDGYAAFAVEIGTELPPRARQVADERARHGG